MSLIFFLLLNFHLNQPKEIPVVKFEYLEKLVKNQSDTTLVINFWATWCKPCVHELPSFDSAYFRLRDEKIKIVLVSLDFVSKYESQLKPFVERNKIEHRVLLLDEPDYDSWINKIDSSWSGAIPATIIINGKNRYKKFFESEFNEKNLVAEIQKSLNSKP